MTDEVRAALLRDVVSHLLRRPATIVAASFAGGGILLSGLVSLLMLTAGVRIEPTSVILPAFLLVLAVVFVLTLRWSVRRALTTSFPVGSVVRAEVEDDGIRTEAALGASHVAFAAFRRMDVRRDTVVLTHRGSSVVSPLPLALFDDAALARLQAGVR